MKIQELKITKLARVSVKLSNTWGLDFDLADQNFIRWHSTLVITDPFYEQQYENN
jgi:hypothetical protein